VSSDTQTVSGNIGLFVTCLVDLFRPSVAFSAARLLEIQGFSVSVPLQSCCGQPAYNSGDEGKTRVLAKQFIEQFEKFDYVVAPSGSCSAMVKIHYPDLFDSEPDWHKRSQQLASRTFELSEFLIDVLKVGLSDGDVKTSNGLAGLPDKLRGDSVITYHDSCSGLRELGIRSQPRELLKQGCGVEINEMSNSEICCGFGGTFCVKFPEISTRMVDNKIEGVVETDANILLGGDLGCLMNIAGRLKRMGSKTRVYHYAEMLGGDSVDDGIAGEKDV